MNVVTKQMNNETMAAILRWPHKGNEDFCIGLPFFDSYSVVYDLFNEASQ